MKIKKKLKKAFILLFVCSAFSAVSQEAMDSVFSELNLAFTRKSAEEVSSVLHKYSSSPQYHDYEAYALKKTRQLIIENDLEFARQTSLAVIDNNLENFDIEIQYRSGAGYHYGRDSLNHEWEIEVDHEEQIVIL